jgi:hypothetical protein
MGSFSPFAGENRLGLAIYCLASLREGVGSDSTLSNYD